jgi:hypothetical protein
LNLKIKPAEFNEIRKRTKEHLNSLPSAIDSFLEAHILESDEEAGFASVHKGSLLTQFSLSFGFRNYGQAVFSQVKKLEEGYLGTSGNVYTNQATKD